MDSSSSPFFEGEFGRRFLRKDNVCWGGGWAGGEGDGKGEEDVKTEVRKKGGAS